MGGGEAETESLILWLLVLRLLAGGWWWHEAQSLIQGLLETHILYTGFENVSPGDGPDSQTGSKKHTVL